MSRVTFDCHQIAIGDRDVVLHHIDGVGTETTGNNVDVLCIAEQIVTAAAVDDIDKAVRTGAAGQGVVAVAPFKGVAAEAADQRIVAATPVQRIVAAQTHQHVVAGVAGQAVV